MDGDQKYTIRLADDLSEHDLARPLKEIRCGELRVLTMIDTDLPKEIDDVGRRQ